MYANNSDPNLYGDDGARVPYTLYDAATNTPLSNKGATTGPLMKTFDLGKGNYNPPIPITLSAKLGIRIPQQRENFPTPQEFTANPVLFIAVGDSQGFENNCKGWDGKGNTGSWASQISTLSNLLMSFFLQTYCSIDSIGTLDFGKFPFLNQNIDEQTDMSVDCSLGTSYAIGMNQGNNFQNGTRNMENVAGDNFVAYELYRDSARTLPWGTKDSDLYKNTSQSLLPVKIPVYGRVPRQSNAAAGAYADQVVVTVKIIGSN